ncbi:spondin domain-containing protein [Oceanospirillum sediminis]|uniref:Spondin domain-containing protein n=1 Tax=Oceanospirillum sediminis TaxID=2760088 RepID=A0A839IRP0_9GAMM|nr:spondin domain-containing protein [Oceanospirillum sediminis]MBB1487107.1 spondin domain-containing protein [Oceanospirillum sediminis]
MNHFFRPATLLRSTLLGTAILGASLQAGAADLTVSITNLTRGVYFTPVLAGAHNPANALFSAGEAASANLQAMAEGGDIAGLSADLSAAGAVVVENPAGGMLQPGMSTSFSLNTDANAANTHLSLVAMMLPTNDGFVALNNMAIPATPGTYTYDLNAYDAGTEANDEIRGGGAPGTPGFPAPGPIDTSAGNNGTGVASNAEGYVHIHRNVLGDTDASGGVSDIDSVVHRWLNPVARVVITVN